MNWLTHLLLDNPALARRLARPASRSPVRESVAWVGVALVVGMYAADVGMLSDRHLDPWTARGILFVHALGVILGQFIIAPATAVAVAGARERGVWQELLLTQLTPLQIAVSELVAGVRPLFVLWLIAVPPLVMAAQIGRMPAGQSAALLAVLLATPLLLTTSSLALSARCRRSLTAVALAYAIHGALVWGALATTRQLLVRGENPWWYVSPVFQAAWLCFGRPQPSPLILPLLPEWLWYLLLVAGVSVGSVASLTRRIARVAA